MPKRHTIRIITWIWLSVITAPVIAASLGFFIEGRGGSGLLASFVLGLYSLLLLLPLAFFATTVVLGWAGKTGVILAIPLLILALLTANLLVDSFYDPEPGRLSRFMVAIVTTTFAGMLSGKALRIAYERKNKLFLAAVTIVPITLGVMAIFYVTAARLSSPLAYSFFDEESFWTTPANRKTENGDAIYHYARHLKLDPFPPRVNAVESYAGSTLVGYSRNPWSLSGDNPSLSAQRSGETTGTKLLHREYDRPMREQLADCRQAVSRTVATVDETNRSVRCQILLYRKNHTLYKKELTLHPNGIVRKIRTFRFDPSNGFLPEEQTEENSDATFDELG